MNAEEGKERMVVSHIKKIVQDIIIVVVVSIVSVEFLNDGIAQFFGYEILFRVVKDVFGLLRGCDVHHRHFLGICGMFQFSIKQCYISIYIYQGCGLEV